MITVDFEYHKLKGYDCLGEYWGSQTISISSAYTRILNNAFECLHQPMSYLESTTKGASIRASNTWMLSNKEVLGNLTTPCPIALEEHIGRDIL